MAIVADSKTIVSKIEYLKKKVIPQYKEIFQYLLETYSKKQAIQTSDSNPDLSNYKDLSSKQLRTFQYLEKLMQNFISKTSETKFFISVIKQEISAENEKLSKILEKNLHLDDINNCMKAEQQSYALEIFTKKQKNQILKLEVHQSLNVQNIKLKANFYANYQDELKKMLLYDSISVNKNTLKQLKSEKFNKEIEIFEKSKSLASAKEQKCFLTQEKKSLEEQYAKIKHESLEIEISIGYTEKSIELIGRDNGSLRFEHEKCLSRCSDQAIQIEKIKNSEYWKTKEDLDKELNEKHEIFKKEVKNLEFCLAERKKRIFEIIFFNYKLVKAFYSLVINAQTAKFNESLANKHRTNLIYFEELKRQEKEEMIKNYEMMQIKNTKREIRKSVKKNQKKPDNQGLPKEIPENEKTVVNLKVFPVQSGEISAFNEKEPEVIIMDVDEDLKDLKGSKKNRKELRKSKTNISECLKDIEKKELNTKSFITEIIPEFQENPNPGNPDKFSVIKDLKSENFEDINNSKKSNQIKSYSNRNKKVQNQHLSNSCYH